MTVSRLLFLTTVCFCVFRGVSTQSLEELIQNTFKQPKPNNNNNNINNSPSPHRPRSTPSPISNQRVTPPLPYVEQTSCVCVPYYLCNNNTIITDGAGLIDIRQKPESCENYIEVCCQEPAVHDDDRATAPVKTRDGCGKRNEDGIGFRITGDTDGESQFGEFPWMAAVLKEEDSDGKKINVFQCGGSLIHPEVVMTAAHCVRSNARYKIRAGEWDTQTEFEIYKHQDIFVSKVVVHPEYYAGALYNDVALLFLERPASLGNNVDVICMPSQNQVFDYSRCHVSGWGRDVFGKEGKYQVILKKVELPVVPRDICQNALRLTRLGQQFKLHSSFICAGGEPNRDACKGDGGSPLVCPLGNSGRYAQAGIVAWGIGCGEQGTPGVYANVASVRNWVDQQMRSKNLDTSFYESP